MTGGDTKLNFFRFLSESVFDVIFPKYCLVCQAEGMYCCELCQLSLNPIYPLACFSCQRVSPYGELCSDCRPRFSFDGVIIVADYEDEIISTMIKQCKYRYIKELGEIMGRLLAQKIKKLLERSNVSSEFEEYFFHSLVTAIPLSNRRRRQREFNQAELIAHFFGYYFLLSSSYTILSRDHRRPQVALSEKVRRKNIAGSFSANIDLGYVPSMVLVIDDVITTGATLEEAARVLKAKGVEKVWGLMIAKG